MHFFVHFFSIFGILHFFLHFWFLFAHDNLSRVPDSPHAA